MRRVGELGASSRRASDGDAPTIAATTKLLADDDAGVQIAAAGFLASMAKHSDGAAAVLRAGEGEVVAALATSANDPSTDPRAKTLGCETLALCTLTDEGVLVALRGGTAKALMRALEGGGEDASGSARGGGQMSEERLPTRDGEDSGAGAGGRGVTRALAPIARRGRAITGDWGADGGDVGERREAVRHPSGEK